MVNANHTFKALVKDKEKLLKIVINALSTIIFNAF